MYWHYNDLFSIKIFEDRPNHAHFGVLAGNGKVKISCGGNGVDHAAVCAGKGGRTWTSF